MSLPELPAMPTGAGSEAGVVACQVAREFGEMLEFYKRHYKVSHEQALEKMRVDDPAYLEHIQTRPPDQLTWLDLENVSAVSPEKGMQLWEQVKQAARDELRSGHRMASAAVLQTNQCWPRARFMAMRDELLDGWKPTNAVERQLVETLALAQTAYLHWHEALTTWTSVQCEDAKLNRRDDGTWLPPRVSDAEAIERAAAMVDRFHRLMVRTIRTLRDLRRYAPKVVVRNAGQVNVGAQQVNVAGGGAVGESGAAAER